MWLVYFLEQNKYRWLLNGVLVTLISVLMKSLFSLSDSYILLIATVFVGWFHYNVEQLLTKQALPIGYSSIESFLFEFTDGLSKANSLVTFECQWQQMLVAYCNPSHINLIVIDDESMLKPKQEHSFYIPSLTGNSYYKLMGKQKGKKLFCKRDKENIDFLYGIVHLTFRLSEWREKTIMSERQQCLHTINLTVLEKLKKLLATSSSVNSRQAVEEVLKEFETLIYGSAKLSSLKLGDYCDYWHAEVQTQIHDGTIQLSWQVESSLKDIELSSHQAFELTNFIYEAISNAIRHAKPTQVQVISRQHLNVLSIAISHDGSIRQPKQWKHGTGLQTMQTRIHSLQGQLSINYQELINLLTINALIPVS